MMFVSVGLCTFLYVRHKNSLDSNDGYGLHYEEGVSSLYAPPFFGSYDTGNANSIGYEFLIQNGSIVNSSSGEILHIWNEIHHFYINNSNGIQLTQDYGNFWSENVLGFEVKIGNEWIHSISLNELTGWTKSFHTDNETYVNVTYWNNFTLYDKNSQMSINFFLNINDTNLTINGGVKNIDTKNLNKNVRFLWRVKNINIGRQYDDNRIFIDNNWYELRNETEIIDSCWNQTYQNCTIYNETTEECDEYGEPYNVTECNYTTELTDIDILIDNPTVAYYKIQAKGDEKIDLWWDQSLNEQITIVSNYTSQYNSPVNLYIDVGTLAAGEEKSTTFYWHDDATAPVLTFTDPTPDDLSSQIQNWTEINITIDDPALHDFTFNWNGTNYTWFDDNLILAYNFNNNSAIGENNTYFVDISNTGNNGIASGGTIANSTGRFGTAGYFDGSNDYINCGTSSSLEPASFTLSAWIYMTEYPDSGEYYIHNIIGHDSVKGYTLRIGYGAIEGNKAKICLTWYDGSWRDAGGTTDMSLYTWYNVVGTLNSSGTGRVYVNGIEDGVSTYGPIDYSSHTLVIGVRPTATPARYFEGLIDEVRIYKRDLSAQEISLMYQSEFQKYNSSQYRFYINNSGTVNATGLPEGEYTYSGWGNDSSGNIGATEQRTLTIGEAAEDTTPPTFSSNSTNETYVSNDVLHSLLWNDDTGLSGYVFQWCNGTWNGSDCSSTVLCYQESANVSTGCGGLDTGDYSIKDFYIYINYTKPTGSLSSSFWQLKQGNETFTNTTIPLSCWDNDENVLQLRVFSSAGVNENNAYSYGQCYNSTWRNFTTIVDVVHGSFTLSYGNYGSNTYDTDYSTYAIFDDFPVGFWSTCSSGDCLRVAFYEEAMFWNITGAGGGVGWVNDSWTSFSTGGLSDWSNVTKKLQSTTGINYSWCVYANDTSNNWNNSCYDMFAYTSISLPTGDSCTCPSGQDWNIYFPDNCTLTTNCDLSGYDVFINGNYGTFTVKANLTVDSIGISLDGDFINMPNDGYQIQILT